MSGSAPPPAGEATYPPASADPNAETRRTRGGLGPVLVDVLVVVVWFAVAGVLGAVLWWQLADLPQVTKSGSSGTLSPEELTKQVSADGWYFVIAAVGGLLSGIVLLLWRRRDPLLMVVLVVLGAGMAAWLMLHAGQALGPAKEIGALKDAVDGTKVSEQLKLRATGIAWVWPLAASFGALVYLWVLRKPGDDAA
jgi:hypothetical protein